MYSDNLHSLWCKQYADKENATVGKKSYLFCNAGRFLLNGPFHFLKKYILGEVHNIKFQKENHTHRCHISKNISWGNFIGIFAKCFMISNNIFTLWFLCNKVPLNNSVFTSECLNEIGLIWFDLITWFTFGYKNTTVKPTKLNTPNNKCNNIKVISNSS